MVAFVAEVEAPEDVEIVQVDGTDGHVVGNGFEDGFVVLVGVRGAFGIQVAGGEALLLDAEPAVSVVLASFFEAGFAVLLVLMEVDHVWVEPLHAFEERDDGGAVCGELHLRTEPHVDVKFVAQRAVRMGHVRSSLLGRIPEYTKSACCRNADIFFKRFEIHKSFVLSCEESGDLVIL